jgi:hypothetical protein
MVSDYFPSGSQYGIVCTAILIYLYAFGAGALATDMLVLGSFFSLVTCWYNRGTTSN